MVSLRGTIRVALVWATAFLTLVSSVPRFSCICPDGGVQSDLPVLFGWSGCRFVSAEMPVVAVAQNKHSCCAARIRAGAESGGASLHLNSPGCRKVLSPADVMAAASGAPRDDHSSRAAPPPALADACPTLGSAAAMQQSCLPRWISPPPTDLVVRLQHILI